MLRRLVVVLALLVACVTCRHIDVPAVGSSVPDEAVHREGEVILAGPSQIYPAYALEVEGVAFELGVKERKVAFVRTSSRDFSTPDGVRVGMPLQAVLERGGSGPVMITGWAFVVALPSGWSAAFTHGETQTEEPLPVEATVAWLFRNEP